MATSHKNEKCPRCGLYFEAKNKGSNYTIRQITNKYSRLTRTLLRKTSLAIMGNIPSDNNQQNYLSFLKLTQSVDETVLRRMLSKYLETNLALQGKGFRYLASMILTENQNKEAKLSNEYKNSGRSPSFDLIKGEK